MLPPGESSCPLYIATTPNSNHIRKDKMSSRPSSRTSSSSTSSSSSTRTCHEKRLPDSPLHNGLVWLTGVNPEKVQAMRLYVTTYENDSAYVLGTRSDSRSSKRSSRSGNSWTSGNGTVVKTKTELVFVLKSKKGGGRESRSSNRSNKSSSGSRRHNIQGRSSYISEEQEEEDEEFDDGSITHDTASVSDDGSVSGFDEFVYRGGGGGGPGRSPPSSSYSPSPFPPGPGMMSPPPFASPAPPPPGSYPPAGGFPGYHQQQPQPMYGMGGGMGGMGGMGGAPPPPMPPSMAPHGPGDFHQPPYPPQMPTPGLSGMIPGGGGAVAGGGHFQQDGRGIQVFMPE